MKNISTKNHLLILLSGIVLIATADEQSRTIKSSMGQPLYKIMSANKNMDNVCSKIVNSMGQEVDTSCDAVPWWTVGSLYASDDKGNALGGKIHNCQWPRTTYAYIANIDGDGICHLDLASTKTDYATNFHDMVCLGTFYQKNETSEKIKLDPPTFLGVGGGFVSDYVGHYDEDTGCFATIILSKIDNKCHMHIDQSKGSTKICPTTGTGV